VDAQVGIIIAITTLAVGLLTTAVKLTWNVRSIDKDIREDLREYMDAQFENLHRDIKDTERGSLDRAETLRLETGEMGSALRTKIHEVEVYLRDKYVPKESFDFVVNRMENLIDRMTEKLENKIDKAVERFQRPQ
jgi:ribosome-associated translation inhibitor RaiA